MNVKEDGDYTMYASVATDNSTAGFSLSIDDNKIADVAVSGSSWDDFANVKANVSLKAGEHILRMTVTGDWFDIDYINFVAGKDAPETPTGLAGNVKLNVAKESTFDVFNLNGKKVASFTARNMAEASKLWQSGSIQGSEKAQGISLIRNRANGAMAKVRTTK